MTRPAGRAAFACATALLAACATTPPAPLPRAAAPVALDVDVAIVPDDHDRVGAARLTFCARPGASLPRRLAPENRRALEALVSATDDEGRPLDVGADGVRVLGLSGCARLVIDLGALADSARDKDVALRIGDDVVATPDVWLWRPDPFPADARLFVRITPGTFAAVLPWTTRQGDRFVVDASTFALKSDAAFGRFTTRALEVDGAVFDVTVVGDDAPPQQITSWLVASARAVAGLAGRFPVPRMAVMLCAQASPRPVLVGYYSRGGGPVALFFVATQATDVEHDDHEATGRWALTHELAHAWLPPVDLADAWFNEGLATWHQDLLARRAGIIKGDLAYWSQLVRGLETGRARAETDGLSIAEASARMHQSGSYQHAYWAGVAIILIAEVEARQQGASIDDVVLALRRRFPSDDRARSATELLATAEAEGGPVAVGARAWRSAWERERDRAFPDVVPTLRALGVATDANGSLFLDDTAPLAHVRRALTASLPAS